MLIISIEIWNLCLVTSVQGFFWHLLPVPVKMEHFLSSAKQWFALGINLCQKKKKKEKQVLEQLDVTPLVSGSAALCTMQWLPGRCGS